jgi:hypothetical protein
MMSPLSKRELLAELRPRYRQADRNEKQRILDELVATTGYHRKYAIQVLNHLPKRPGRRRRPAKPEYDGRVTAALEQCWRVANGICGKRLVPVLPEYVAALERHGELVLDAETRGKLLRLSPATADRLLKRARERSRPHGLATTKPGALLKQSIPIRTFAQWDDAQPGFMEVDLVAHCGDTTSGEYLNSLDMVDVKTRWNEFVPLLNKSQAAVTAGIEACRQRLPYALLGLDSDNGAEFINNDLKRYCELGHITFTRCRPYKKNDQAYIEQKNWTTVRQTVGYDRYEGQAAYEALAALYAPLRLYINFFQPVMVLISKQRDGARVKKHYDQAKTPYQRVLDAPEVAEDVKERLRQQYATLNPAALLRQIQAAQEALWKLAHKPAPAVVALWPGSSVRQGTRVPRRPSCRRRAGRCYNLKEMTLRTTGKVRSYSEATIPLK